MADAQKPLDVALALGASEDGSHRVLRLRAERAHERASLALAELRPLEEGKPIHGEVVELLPRPDHPQLFDVKVHYTPPARTLSGPAQVATERYRRGWEATFGERRSPLPS